MAKRIPLFICGSLIVLASLLFSVQISWAAPAAQSDPTATATPEGSESDTPAGSPTPVGSPTPTPTEYPVIIPLIVHEPIPQGYGPDTFPYNIDPLTGLLVEDVTRLARRPIVVKITNYPRTVRPQAGLSKADIIYEYYMERGVPRFIAVFYGQDAELVGPVRSGRFFDEHIFRMVDGIFVFGSADERVLGYFLSLGDHIVNSFMLETLEDRAHDCAISQPRYLCRDRTIESYNNLFTNTAELTEYIRRRNGQYTPDLTGMFFSPRTPGGGAVALEIYSRYSLFIYNKWIYNVDTGRYMRWQETIGYADTSQQSYEPLIDRLTAEQLGADNVVALIVPHHYFVKTPTTEIIDIPLIGSGQAFVFRDGFAFPAIWVRPEDGGVLQLTDINGEPFPLKPGTTWFQVFSTTSEISNGAVDWHFNFIPPEVPEEPINPDGENPPYGWFAADYYTPTPEGTAAATATPEK